jgi:hypothetical protein
MIHIVEEPTYIKQKECHGCARKDLDSAVMTTWAESMISYGLIRVVVLGR